MKHNTTERGEKTQLKRRAVSGIVLTLLLIGVLALVLNIQPLKASGTVYIRADGSVDPPTAPISTADQVTYTFTDNIYDEIVVERDDIVVDGVGYTLQGMEGASYIGIDLAERNNITAKNMNVKNFAVGIYLDSSSNINISRNNITANNDIGIAVMYCSDNNISENNITNNGYGIRLDYSYESTISGNMINGNMHNFGVWGIEPSHFMHSVDVSNLVDGKPIYYLVNQKDLLISPATHPLVGYLALINCTNVTVQTLALANNVNGLPLVYTNNSRIIDNNITNNEDGIQLFSSSDNNISGNNITNNGYGVRLDHSYNNTISGNDIANNGARGIQLSESSSNNTVSRNTIIANNYDGICLAYSSDYNTVSGNNIANNGNGIYVYQSSNNKFCHNNFIDNTNQVDVTPPSYVNFWDDAYPSGGNYWSDYSSSDSHSGPEQDQLGSDGVGDTSYIINTDNIDRYPLISPFPQASDFDITASPSTGTTAQGTIATINVHASTIAEYDYLVSLSASGQPEGVTINFNPNTGTPYFTSTMTIQVGDSVPPDTYLITITGSGSDGKTHSTTYTLTVTYYYPPVPEFPLGIEAATAIGLMAVIAYIGTRKRKTKTIKTAHSNSPFFIST